MRCKHFLICTVYPYPVIVLGSFLSAIFLLKWLSLILRRKNRGNNGSRHLLVEITPMPNSFLPKLISYLHIKGNERHIQNHNP